MTAALKFLLFLFVAYGMILGFLWLYRQLNDRIIASNNLLQLLGYTLLLLAANLVLFVGGSLLLFSLYLYLS